MMERGLLEEKTQSRGKRLSDFVSNSCLLLGAVAAVAGLAHVVLKRWPATDCGSSHSQVLARLQDVAFFLPFLVVALGVVALIARTDRRGRATIGMILALFAATAVLAGFECSVTTP